MKKANDINWIIEDINNSCKDRKNGGYFWAYGLLKETKNLWENEEWKNRLCEDAQIMLKTIDLE